MEEKKCTKCNRILPLENFRWKNKALNKNILVVRNVKKQLRKLDMRMIKKEERVLLIELININKKILIW